jgi:CubicO group peptidase (beta-lactamase class C family)
MKSRLIPLQWEKDPWETTSCLPPFASERFLTSVDQLFTRALTEQTFSGASLLVAKPDSIPFHKTWGHTHLGGFAIESQTLFDLASLTKPLIIAPLCMRAVSERRFALDDTLCAFFPSSLLTPEKKTVTIRQLLNHSSGLPAYEPFYHELILLEPSRRRDFLLERILNRQLLSAPGTTSCYSDLGFILLTRILEKVYDNPLDDLASKLLLRPLGIELKHSRSNRSIASLGFCRLRVLSDPTIPPERLTTVERPFAATEECPWRKRLLTGEVHDENAYCLDGVAGHAGLFGTAHGILCLLLFLWEVYCGKSRSQHWKRHVVREFWSRQSTARDSTWMLGFDTPSPRNSSAGDFFSPLSPGHLGFTGTSFWFDLDREILVILLTNRVYPTRENERLKRFRPLLHNLVMETYHESSGC